MSMFQVYLEPYWTCHRSRHSQELFAVPGLNVVNYMAGLRVGLEALPWLPSTFFFHEIPSLKVKFHAKDKFPRVGAGGQIDLELYIQTVFSQTYYINKGWFVQFAFTLFD